jgi:hypothetical protein
MCHKFMICYAICHPLVVDDNHLSLTPIAYNLRKALYDVKVVVEGRGAPNLPANISLIDSIDDT